MKVFRRVFARYFDLPKHDWEDRGVQYEPGISDVHGGMWARRLIVCRKCRQFRKVYRGMDLASDGMTFGCSG